MDKRILNEIAKRWCKGILMMNDVTDEKTNKLLSQEEADYLVAQSEKIANRITDKPAAISLNDLIQEYYEIE